MTMTYEQTKRVEMVASLRKVFEHMDYIEFDIVGEEIKCYNHKTLCRHSYSGHSKIKAMDFFSKKIFGER